MRLSRNVIQGNNGILEVLLINQAMEISSAQNKIFKKYKSLSIKKNREREGLFLLEGQRYVDTAITHGHAFESVVFDKDTWASVCQSHNQTFYLEACQVFVFTDAMIKELTQTEQSQGIIGVAKIAAEKDVLEAMGDNILLLDRLQDPGNLGTIIRTADAAGFGTIILTKGTVDPYNPKVVRSTAGSILNVDLVEVEDKLDFIERLKVNGYKVIVTALEDALDYNDTDGYDVKNCIVIGNEANGVSDEIMDNADARIKIPIIGKAESLNAAVAAAIMMYKVYEITRSSK